MAEDQDSQYSIVRTFLSGIGGIGMSAYAGHLLAQGHEVYGSDKALSPITQNLIKQGAKISNVQDGSAIPENVDLFVYSEAIPENSPERMAAQTKQIKSLSYFQAVGELTKGTELITVTGTHGKSSTTAMAAKMLMDCGKDPSIVVGTKMFELDGKNWRAGSSSLWIVEACEYRKSFLGLQPKIVLVTNIDGDHFDAFPTMEAYTQAFEEFLAKVPNDGCIIFHGNDERVRSLVEKSNKTAIDADALPLPPVAAPGVHMQQNAQLVMALAKHLGIDQGAAGQSVAAYRGSWRRMEEIGMTKSKALLIDDYAHHPTEIKATLRAMRMKFGKRRIVAVFQPHTHDRTFALWNEFATAFAEADLVILLDVYDARPDRETDIVDITKLAADMRKESAKDVMTAGNVNTAAVMIGPMLKKDDVCIIMGAGDISALAAMLKKQF